MQKKIPIIILWNDVVFPYTIKDLTIDKEVNIQACKTSQEKHSSKLIVVTVKDSTVTSSKMSKDKLLEVGVLCDLVSFSEFQEDGVNKARIRVVGQSRARIESFSWSRSSTTKTGLAEYSLFKTKKTKNPEAVVRFSTTEGTKRKRGSKTFSRLLNDSNGNLEKIIDIFVSSWSNDKQGVVDIKRSVLCEPNLFSRLKILLSVELKNSMAAKDEEISEEDKAEFKVEDIIDEQIGKKVSRNISRQQKEFYLREKLRVIKEELGDASSKEIEIRKIKNYLSKGHFPDHVVKKAKEELQRFELCSSYSNEATVIRSYLDWLLNLPWKYVSQDEMDLKKVQEVLDKNHYGLEKIKERIIEFLSIKKKSNKEVGTIICLVGPPGVGKTSLAQSIAEALNKKFVKISLGGLYDESELRGHRRTYVASMPGKIIRGLRQAKVKNPVFLLDEVDKISAGYHGDPIHALLEILDPKQNCKFNDHYLEEDFDLSRVMFIATANYDDNIPGPLWDRMEMIYLKSYTESEKLSIAKEYLIPEVLKASGLEENELKFSDEAITFIIQRYTKEAGVRNLKRQIEKVVRKVVKDMVVDDKSVTDISPKEARHYLDYELYDVTKKDDENIPGIVNGMAYTEFGGDLLPIEVNHVKGKGNLSLTGNLRDTMKESASVALSYVRANEEVFGLKDSNIDWANLDVNLHVPTGGIPKDGPSAGVTIVTAIISSFSGKPVSPKVAMTGEITLRGKVLPIGGLREKVISAVRGGVDTIFYPEENNRNLADIPEDIKEKIELIPAKSYMDIYNRLFATK